MNPIEQQIEIAKACGWREAFPSSGPAHPGTRKGGIMLPYNWINEVDGRRVQDLPNYLHDLNAMHAAVMTLPAELWQTYIDTLIPVVDGGPPREHMFAIFNATASKRAEAFLRTIGKWKD